jgi:hypothetical protein
MGQGRVAGAERMLSLVGDNTELGCSKLKIGKGFSGPNLRAGAEAGRPANSLSWGDGVHA